MSRGRQPAASMPRPPATVRRSGAGLADGVVDGLPLGPTVEAVTPSRRPRSRLIRLAVSLPVLLLAAPPALSVYPVYISPAINCVVAGEPILFAASGGDVDFGQGAVIWDFDDGTTSDEHSVTHGFANPGLRRVSLTATGRTGTATTERPLFVTPRGSSPKAGCTIFRFGAVRGALGSAEGGTVVRGRVILPNGAGAAAVRIGLQDSGGAVRAITQTGVMGTFRFLTQTVRPARWRLVMLDHRDASAPPSRVVTRPRLILGGVTPPTGEGRTLVVRGRLEPTLAGKLVQLEFRAPEGWRPVVQSHTRRHGLFALRYGFRGVGASYSVRMRVAAPRDREWSTTVATRPFTVRVEG